MRHEILFSKAGFSLAAISDRSVSSASFIVINSIVELEIYIKEAFVKRFKK